MGTRLTLTLIAALFLCGAGWAATLSPQDQFLQLYFSLQEAQQLEDKQQFASARDHYKDINEKLETLKKTYPDWEPTIVNFRIKFVRDKLAELADKKDAAPAKSAPSTAPATALAPVPAAPQIQVDNNTPADTAVLRQRITALEHELAETKSQLSTALAQAVVLRQRLDAAEHELATAKSANLEERVAGILNENNALKAQLAEAEKKIKAVQDGSADSVPVLKDQLQKVQAQLAALETENQSFKTTTNDLKQQLELAKAKLADADQASAGLGALDSVRKENEVLRGILTRQLQEQARRDAAKRLASDEIESLHIQSKILQQQIDLLGSPIVVLTPEEKTLLRVDPASVAPSSTTPAPAPAGNTLEAKLETPPAPATGDATAAPATGGDAAKPDADLSAKPKVPEEMRPLAQQAGELFAHGKYEEAAALYQKIIDRYPDSLYAWSNLGVVRFQQQRYPEAEKALLEAVKLNPNDAFSYSILGIVDYQEGRFDDAIEKLTRASTLNPNDARTRNYLGIACSQKGWQEAAEKQLRKAIELDPSLGDAHFNLAVIYASQKPPARELARKHYKAALDLGIPKDPQLEKFFSEEAIVPAAAPTGTAPAPAPASATDAKPSATTDTPVPAPAPASTTTNASDATPAPVPAPAAAMAPTPS
jgi:Flp pilus assembly protein TadD